jgi:hypothetical protein
MANNAAFFVRILFRFNLKSMTAGPVSPRLRKLLINSWRSKLTEMRTGSGAFDPL